MARETKLTPDVQQTICDEIRKGLPIVRAAKVAGISEPTFYRWMQQGEPDAPGEPQLRSMPIATLRALARDAGITVPAKATKPQIVTVLDDAGLGSWENFRKFREAVEAADVELERRFVENVEKASRPIFDDAGKLIDAGRPNVLLTFMARRFKHWSPTQTVEVSGPEGEPVSIEVRAKAIAASAAAFKSTTKETAE
jgi:predicted DNA-binding transcriptional regulator AlpA